MTQHPLEFERQRLKRRNSAISVVFAAVVCVVALVVAINTLTTVGEGSDSPFGDLGAPPVGATPPPTPAAPASPPASGQPATTPAPEPTEPPPPPTQFESPSGNIGCAITVDFARCDIGERQWDPGPAPENCTKSWGQGLVVADGDATISCFTGSVLGQDTVLEYGRNITMGSYTCSSSEAGMRCVNTTTGKGFSISRAAYTLF